MKKILLDSNKKFYKANLHCHSTKSDGSMTVEELKDHYKSNGYSVLAITDHEHIIDNSYVNDEDFLTITSCELAIKEFPEFSTGKKRDMKVCHLNLYAKEPHNVDTPCYSSLQDRHFLKNVNADDIVHTCGEYERVYSADGINEIINIANEKGFLVSYNHPVWSLENESDYLNYKNIWALEIYNHDCFVSGYFEYNIGAYDKFLRSGQKIAAVAADDCHATKSSLGGFVMINADKLDYNTIIKALEEHNLYASTGPIINGLYIEDGKAYISYIGEYATISTRGRRAARQNAENPGGENVACFDILEDDGYIRFSVADKYGHYANTCAYFLEDF